MNFPGVPGVGGGAGGGVGTGSTAGMSEQEAAMVKAVSLPDAQLPPMLRENPFSDPLQNRCNRPWKAVPSRV